MSFGLLPANVLVKIVDQLPFKDRVRIRDVNQSFRYASEQSIGTMRSLIVTDEFLDYVYMIQQFSSLLESCSSTLESIDASSHLCNKSLIKAMSHFVYPRLKHLKIAVIDNEQSKKMITGNLRSIVLHLHREFDWPEDMAFENLEHLEIRLHRSPDYRPINRDHVNLSPILRPLIGEVPNLKRLWIKNDHDAAPLFFPMEELSQLMASAPSLEELILDLSGRDGPRYLKMYQDLEAAISTWHAPKLTTLGINFAGLIDHIPPSFIHNFPSSFPRLKSFSSPKIREIDDQAVAALSSLESFRELRLPSLQISKEKLTQMITSLSSITVLHISPGRVLWGSPFKIDGQLLEALSYLQNLSELYMEKSMTMDEFLDVATSVPSIAIIQITAISDVNSPQEFLQFLTSTAAQIHRNMEIRLWMNANTVNETELSQMEVALEEIKNTGGPVVEVDDEHRFISIRYGSVIGQMF